VAENSHAEGDERRADRTGPDLVAGKSQTLRHEAEIPLLPPESKFSGDRLKTSNFASRFS
jgi:hypothetical protein